MKTSLIRYVMAASAFLLTTAAWSLDDIQLPPGFSIDVYAEVPGARSLALGEKGTVFVSNRKGSAVYAVVSDGGRTRTIKLLDGLDTPNGIAVHDGDLYVAEIDRVTRYDDIEANLSKVPDGIRLDIDLPSERHHGWRYIGFGPDDKLYVSIGVPCNICDEVGYGQIIRMQADGGERETVANGVRNSVGFTWHPDNGELWFTDNGRDMLGDDLPADELNHASSDGQHFGYPYCHQGDTLDPEFGVGKDCADYRAPAQKLGAHVAPLGVRFYTGTQFPAEYRNQIFIAEHGSWNRSKRVGYRVSLVRLEDGVPVSYEPFASGWLKREAVSGRPVDLLVLTDGSLLVSDDHADRIYRIRYSGSEN
ncbi:MAG: PQQ-dependent sugar dehydrogenase [Gammaproteobacteria bacterium]|nr:PQQ-dependent sugar dehydrogenase [Gammaproteobacteria bacterium]MDH5260258.1 PQQ-dependent sugar dehydrogenase [Gammaproteobacteria bacterium]